MLINWFTVIAQIINFLILVWLLKRYLYKPILKAIDEREKKIASQIEDAAKKDAAAKNEKAEFQKKNDDFDKAMDDLMKKAMEETKVEKNKLLEEARATAKALQEKLETALKEDQKNLGDEIAQKTKSEVFVIAKKALQQLANASLEEQIVNVFIQRLQQLDKEEEKKLMTAFKASDKPIIVRSTFELTTAQHTAIKKSLKEEVGHSPTLKFETTPELISGIEINANGYKVEWSIADYLASVEKSIEEIIHRKTKTAEPDKTIDKHQVKEVNKLEEKDDKEKKKILKSDDKEST